MPGVVVLTETQAGPSAALRNQSSQLFAAGLTERGSTSDAILVRGMADVERLTGGRVTYGALYDQLQTYFDEGGLQARIARVVGPAATVGTLTLQDRAGTPANTLRVDAANPGAWSTQLKVQVLDGSVANTFRIVVTLNGVPVQDINNIATPAAAVIAFRNSEYIRIANLGSATTAPNNNPAVAAATALSAGSDDRVSITATHYLNSLGLFTKEMGDGAVAIPGQTSTAIWQGIDTHCRDNNRIGILSAAISATKSQLLARNAEVVSEYSGVFAPWIVIPDGQGGTRTISPEGYVAACRARAHDQVGPWKVPAGSIASANTVTDVETEFRTGDANDLDDGRINVIRIIANTVRLYGWRSLSDDAEYTYLKDRDLLNNLVVEGEKVLEQFVFATIDRKGQLLSQVNASLVGLVDPIASAGGLYSRTDELTGQEIDPGYKVDTGSSVNTSATLAMNQIKARLLVRIAPTGGLISLTIVKVAIQSGL